MKSNLRSLLVLGLVAAFGRVTQLGGFGEINSVLDAILEVVVNASRLLVVYLVLGMANLRKFGSFLKSLFMRINRVTRSLFAAWQKFKPNMLVLSLNFIGFLLIAGALNFLIDRLAYNTPLLITLKRAGILAANSSEWTILLFLKNLSVIPFTLIFETIVVIWIAEKTKGSAVFDRPS